MSASVIIRPGRDEDADGFIALIDGCWREYPGIIMDVDGEMPELRTLATHYGSKGGILWAAEAAGQVVGMVAVYPHGRGTWEISRVYVRRDQHGGGLAHTLLSLAEAHACRAGAAGMELWSDTRFERAHAFYEKRSYVRAGSIRVLHDVSNSIEFHYAKSVDGIAVLDAAGAASAERRLTALLCACVDAGASVSFLPPLAPATARAYWRRVAGQVATGTRILLAGWIGGELVGTVMLDTAMPNNQPHRAEVKKLLVHPSARRRGLGRRLMERVEQEARDAGRWLLTLDTRAGDAGYSLFCAIGWIEAGRIPDYLLGADRTPSDNVIFYKRLTYARCRNGGDSVTRSFPLE